MKKIDTKNLCFTAIIMALVFVVTRFIQIPIPLGYFNVGNCVIMLSCLIVPSPYGIIAGSFGSALADLTSYPAYTVPTLIIKFLFPLVFYKLSKTKAGKIPAELVAAAVSTLIPFVGYTITGGIIYGNIITGLAQAPGLFLEYIANLIIFAALYKPVKKIRL